MIPDYRTGINGGFERKLASFIDLVVLNVVLYCSHINLHLTNRAETLLEEMQTFSSFGSFMTF